MAKDRVPVASKDDYVAAAQPALEKVLGTRVSKTKVWDSFKILMAAAFSVASSGKALSLSGVGRFNVYDSQRSVKVGKPAKRMRFRSSVSVTRVLNEGGDFLVEMSREEATVAAPEVKAETGAAAQV